MRWGGWRIDSELPGLKVRGVAARRPARRAARRRSRTCSSTRRSRAPNARRGRSSSAGDEVVAVPGHRRGARGDGRAGDSVSADRARARRRRGPDRRRTRSSARIAELGEEISADYAGRDLLLVGVLKGAVFFMADLMRRLTIPCEIDFMAISSYGASTDSSGVVRILKDLDINIEGRDVLVVEDIIDSGLTLSYLDAQPRGARAREPRVCALLTKPERREIDVPVRYVGFEIPNRFVIGYGLDFAERYRNLPYVGVLARRPDARRRVSADPAKEPRRRSNGGVLRTLRARPRESLLPQRALPADHHRGRSSGWRCRHAAAERQKSQKNTNSQLPQAHREPSRQLRSRASSSTRTSSRSRAARSTTTTRRSSSTTPSDAVAGRRSRTLLEHEGVAFDSKGTGGFAVVAACSRRSCRSCS